LSEEKERYEEEVGALSSDLEEARVRLSIKPTIYILKYLLNPYTHMPIYSYHLYTPVHLCTYAPTT
jgi:hypothetical protein